MRAHMHERLLDGAAIAHAVVHDGDLDGRLEQRAHADRVSPLLETPVQIAVVDYGMGNRRSVEKALMHVGAHASVTSDAAQLRAADGLVVPGVGAFPRAMQSLRSL